jgi:hypothetical protein
MGGGGSGTLCNWRDTEVDRGCWPDSLPRLTLAHLSNPTVHPRLTTKFISF